MHARPEGREHADAPVAQLIPETLDDDVAVAGQHTGGFTLVREVAHQVVRRPGVQAVVRLQHGARRRFLELGDLSGELTQGAAELQRTPRAFPVPEGQLPGFTGRGLDDHAIASDLLDAPRGRAERECLAGLRLVHHLLVQLAHARSVRPHVHGEQAAIGNGARVDGGQHPGAPAPADHVAFPVPQDARSQLGEVVRRIESGQHIEHGVECRIGQLAEVCRPPHQRGKFRHAPFLHARHRDDVLRKHVERILGDAKRLNRPQAHALRHHRGLEQIAAVLGKDSADAGFTNLVAGAADALQTSRDRAGRLDQDDQVHCTHVDAELERAGRDESAQLTGLQLLLDGAALFLRETAMMRTHQLLSCLLVQALSEPLAEAATVHKDERRVMRPDQLEEPGIHGRPDAVLAVGLGFFGEHERARRTIGCKRRVAAVLRFDDWAGHVLHRDNHLQIEIGRNMRIHNGHRTIAAQEAGDFLGGARGR